MNTKNNTVGGGEVLQYMNGDGYSSEYTYMDNALINQFDLLTVAKVIIILMILLSMAMIILRLLKIKSPFKGRGILNEIDHMREVRKRDNAIIRANKIISSITTIIEHTPLASSAYEREYTNYNLIRADIRIPGGHRVMKAEEYNAIVKTLQIILSAVGLIISLLFNYLVGFIIIIGAIVLGGTLPMTYIRNIVRAKDDEIIENFTDFYLMIHYVLIARANTPLTNIMKSYDKTTTSDEMHKFVDICVSNIDTYGEYEGPSKIAERYKEIAVVTKLMRLIRQSNEGADVAPELKGFRAELITAKKYALEKKNNKIIARAKASFALLMPILVQAIISAMAIYVKDLSIAGSFM